MPFRCARKDCRSQRHRHWQDVGVTQLGKTRADRRRPRHRLQGRVLDPGRRGSLDRCKCDLLFPSGFSFVYWVLRCYSLRQVSICYSNVNHIFCAVGCFANPLLRCVQSENGPWISVPCDPEEQVRLGRTRHDPQACEGRQEDWDSDPPSLTPVASPSNAWWQHLSRCSGIWRWSLHKKICAIEKLSFAMKYILNLNQIYVKLNIKLVIIDSFLYRKNAYLSETVPYSRQILHMLKCTHSSLQVTGEPMPDVRWYKDGACIDINRYPRFSSFSSEGSVSVVLAWRRVCPSYVDLIIISKGSFDFVILRKEYEI